MSEKSFHYSKVQVNELLAGKQPVLSFTPENEALKTSDTGKINDLNYPSTKFVAQYVADHPGAGVASVTGTAPINVTPGANPVVSLDSSGFVPSTRAISTTAPLTGGGALSSDLTLAIPAATGSANGYLTSADWATFNGKQAAGNYITALTGDVTASGPGSAAAALAATGVSAGSYGSSTTVATFTVDAKGRLTAATATTISAGTNINTSNEASDATCFPVFVTASGTQTLPAKTNTSLTYNSSTGALQTTKYVVRATTAEGELFDFRDAASAATTLGYNSTGQLLCTTNGSCFAEIRNLSAGSGALAEWTVTGDDPDDFGGMGVVGSGYSISGYGAYPPGTVYLYSNQSDMLINAAGSGKKVYFAAGGYDTANVNGYWGNDGLHSYITVATGYETTVTSAGTKTLTNLSPQQQYFSGSTTHTLKLPSTATLTLGQTYRIHNDSTGVVSVQTSTAAALAAIPNEIEVSATVVSTANNNAASWDIVYLGQQTGAFTVESTTASTPAASNAWGSIGGLSAAPAAAANSGNVVTVTNSTSKIECTVNATGNFRIWTMGNCDGAATSPYFGFRFYYNSVASGIQTDILNNSGYYPDINVTCYKNITGGQVVELKWAQLNGTGQRTSTMKHLTFNWEWKPTL